MNQGNVRSSRKNTCNVINDRYEQETYTYIYIYYKIKNRFSLRITLIRNREIST